MPGKANLIYVWIWRGSRRNCPSGRCRNTSVYNGTEPRSQRFDEYFDRLSRALGQGPLPVSKRACRPQGFETHRSGAPRVYCYGRNKQP